MAIREEIYERYIATEMVFELMKQARRAKATAELARDFETMEYWRGYAEGLDKAYSIMLHMFATELRKFNAEISSLREALRRAEHEARRPRFWSYPQ